MSCFPHIVAEFIAFDDANPFEPIKLAGAVSNPDSYDHETHGQLTAVIRYHTPYTDPAGHPITLSFGLGHHVAVNSIIGWPVILDLSMDLSISTMSVISHTLRHHFPITCRSSTMGVPEDVEFDVASFLSSRKSALTSSPPTTPNEIPRIHDDTSAGFTQRTVTFANMLSPRTSHTSFSNLNTSMHFNPDLPPNLIGRS
jgi:hypothetical protein